MNKVALTGVSFLLVCLVYVYWTPAKLINQAKVDELPVTELQNKQVPAPSITSIEASKSVTLESKKEDIEAVPLSQHERVERSNQRIKKLQKHIVQNKKDMDELQVLMRSENGGSPNQQQLLKKLRHHQQLMSRKLTREKLMLQTQNPNSKINRDH